MSAPTTPVSFGLVGRRLGHSWSRQIHARLGSVPYDLVELEPDEVEAFVREGSWQGLNVTIPYKADAARLADERSERVARLGVANTLLRRDDGSIFAENTDVLGFSWMLERFCQRHLGSPATDVLAGRKALVLGTGGAAQAVTTSLEAVGARVIQISRTGAETYEGFAARHADTVLLVNATPVGMYPNCPATPLALDELSQLTSLVGVLDVIYNPLRTQLVLDARSLGLPAECGLAMLVAQALRSSELWQGITLDDALVEEIEHDLTHQMRNVALIGMPGAGKTSTGKRLAHLMGRPFVDIDDACTLEAGITPGEMIKTQGEDAFRKVESTVVARYGSSSGIVIACGGGVVTRERNRLPLLQNSLVVMLDRPLEELSTEGRPLSGARGVYALAAERMDAYHSWADVIHTCTGTATGDAAAILETIKGL
ncbi:MAG: shikimate kinase [Atopobiaceae bacterium]|nr:shikimate kinase [Atopobiaceae bacterium]